MGVAEAIPGVSGGTIAFITGIYYELIETIKSITPDHLKLLFKDPKQFWKAINGNFLLILMIGMLVGIVFGILVITHFIDTEREILWGFFFGLVIASAVLLGKQVKWSIKCIALAIIGVMISWGVTMVTPSDGTDNLIYIYIAGMIAVSALMLPGVSGSFILLLFGLYHTIMDSLKNVIKLDFASNDLLLITVMSGGILTGLFSFARMLSYFFKHYAHSTMAFLIGILLGSLNKLWPWKLIVTAYDKINNMIIDINSTKLPDQEAYKIISETNLWPVEYLAHSDPKTAYVLIAMMFGILIVALMGYFEDAQD